MTRGVLLSLLIHVVAIYALIFSFSKPKLLGTKTKSKVISLSFVKLEKRSEKVKVKSEKPKPKIKPKIKKKKVKKYKSKPKKQKTYHKKKPTYLNPQPSTLNPKPSTLNPQPTTPKPTPSYLNLNRSKIYEAIQRAKRYPPLAKRLRKEGVVKTCFDLLPSKEVKNITTSGASKILQKGAYQTILEAKQEFPKPNKKVNICLNIVFKLL